MPSINKCLVAFALALSTASALSHNGHIARSNNNHNDIAARNNIAVDTHLAKKDNHVVREAALKRRASNSARCKSRPKSSSSSSSSSHKADATPAKAVAADPPKSSSHKKDPPKSSSAHKAAATTKADASSGGSSADSGLGGALVSFIGGIGTFFFQNGVAGACGTVHQDSDFVVALFTEVYDNGKYCGKQVKVTNQKNGVSQTATVADECPTCKNKASLDCSKGLAEALGITTDIGEVPIAYEILS